MMMMDWKTEKKKKRIKQDGMHRTKKERKKERKTSKKKD